MWQFEDLKMYKLESLKNEFQYDFGNGVVK